MATVEQICALMEAWAPVRTQYSFDNSGLQTGDRCAEVSRVLVALDADEAVLKECVQKQAQLLITHHPLIFSPLRSVGSDTREGRLLMKAIRSGVAVYSSHTPLDGAEGGVNDELCRLLGVVPSAGLELQYSDAQRAVYCGRVGELHPPVRLRELSVRTAAALGAGQCRVIGDDERLLHRAAVCSGAGGSFVQAAAEAGADVLITGELKHHEMLAVRELGLCAVEAGHYYTEAPVTDRVIEYLQNRIHVLQYKVQVMKSECQCNPFH